ncbi:MAG: nitroreductase family protein [Bacteroidales bacterium]
MNTENLGNFNNHRQQIKLPDPLFDKIELAFHAFENRKTSKTISDKKLPLQIISTLLWAACGVNRKESFSEVSGRTAASASNSQEIDIYTVFEEGIYKYDPFENSLIFIIAGDFRSLAIGQAQANFDPGVKAPVRLIYVVDIAKLMNTKGFKEPGLNDPEVQKSYYYVDTGIIAGNVYLFAASQGLAAWFHNCNKQALTEKLNLCRDQRVLFGQTVGFIA